MRRKLILPLLFSLLLLGLAGRLTQAQDTITAIADIQSQFSQGDDSALVGTTVTIEGIVTGVYGDLFFVEDPAGGPWSGISVYQLGHAVVQGDQVQITGAVTEFHDLTQIEPTEIVVLSSNHPLPDPVLLKVQEAKHEQWEGVLVRVENVVVVDGPDDHGEWRIQDESGLMRVDDKGVFYNAQPGENISEMLAIVDHAFGNYRLIPRSLHDIVQQNPQAQPTATLPENMTAIYAIQGDGLSTPLEGQRVDTFGAVTAVGRNGFFLQDPVGDNDPNTSDGIYVYTDRRPSVTAGDCVLVEQAAVSEYYEKTELSRAKAIRPVDLCPATPIEPVTVPLAHLYSDPARVFERYEGMLVQVEHLQGVVQGPTKRFRNGDVEIAFVARSLLPYIEGRRVFRDEPQHSSALMFLSNHLGAQIPEAAWGDLVMVNPRSGSGSSSATSDTAPAYAVMDYNYGKYQLMLLPEQIVATRSMNRVNDEAMNTAPDEFSVCTFNVLGLGRGGEQYPDPTEYDRQIRKRARAIAEGLNGCTIVGLEETGTPEDAQNLAQVLKDEFQLDYEAVSIAGPNSSSLEFPLTNSLLVRKDRVDVLAAESRQGCSKFSYSVRYMPGACPRGQYALFNRPPLVVDLAVHGNWDEPYRMTVIVNHWKSKGGDESVNIVRRTLQAQHVADLVQERLDADSAARVVVLGDLNDFYDSGPVEKLRNGTTPALTHAYDFLPRLDRYTYIFNGASQALDHILFTPAMRSDFAGLSPLHINADFPEREVVDPATVYRSSDHDPVQMILRPGGAGWIGGDLRVPGILVALEDKNGQLITETITDDLGEYRIWNLAPGDYRLRYELPPAVHMDQQLVTLSILPGAGLFYKPNVSHQAAELGGMDAILSPAAGVDAAASQP